MKRRHSTLSEFDQLPRELRFWLTEAKLPWSARSVTRLWSKALRQTGGDRQAAVKFLSDVERRTLKKDAPKVWGTSYPISEKTEVSRATAR